MLPPAEVRTYSAKSQAWEQALCARSDVCLICGEPGPNVTYVWTGGRAAIPAACDALWKRSEDSDQRR